MRLFCLPPAWAYPLPGAPISAISAHMRFLSFLHRELAAWEKRGRDPRRGRGREKGREGTPLFPSRGIQPLRGNSNIGEWVVPFRQTTPKRGHLLFSAQFRPEICAISASKKRFGIFWQEISQATKLPDMKRRVAMPNPTNPTEASCALLAHESRNGVGHPCGSGLQVTL